MTNYNNTDKIIKAKFESVDPVFDAESMWTDLAPKVERKSRKVFFFWMLSGLIVIAIGTFNFDLLGVNQEENYTQNSKRLVNSGSVAEIEKERGNDVDQYTEQNNHGQFELVRNELDNNTTDEIVLLGSNNSQNFEVNTSSTDVDNSILRQESDFSKTDFIIFHESKLKNDLPRFSDASVLSSALKGEELKLRSNLNSPIVLPYHMTSEIYYSRESVEGLPSNMIVGMDVAPLKKSQWRLGLDGGYYIHSRSFDYMDVEPSVNFDSRSTEEKAKDGYDLGIKLEYFLSDHLVVVGGFRLSKSYVERKADYAYTETITLKDHVVAIINTEQGPVEVLEDITYDGIFIHKADNYITATRLGLVAGLQYRIGVDRWTTHVDAGVEFPLWNSHSGIITHERRPYDLSDDVVDINTSSLQVYGGFGVEYGLTSSTALHVDVRGYMPTNNEQVASYVIEKKSALLGVNLGVHFRL